jgi:hypothetical protein
MLTKLQGWFECSRLVNDSRGVAVSSQIWTPADSQVCRAHALARVHARCDARALVPRDRYDPVLIRVCMCMCDLQVPACWHLRFGRERTLPPPSPANEPPSFARTRQRAPKFAERTRLRACTRVATRVRWCLVTATA